LVPLRGEKGVQGSRKRGNSGETKNKKQPFIAKPVKREENVLRQVGRSRSPRVQELNFMGKKSSKKKERNVLLIEK